MVIEFPTNSNDITPNLDIQKGILIVFEGPDMSGKSTMAALAYEHLNKEFPDRIIRVRDPGGTVLGEKIRGLLTPGIDLRTELLLYEAARADMVASIISPALAEGKIVISDRFTLSTTCYQGHGRGLSIDAIKWLNDYASADVVPDIMFVYHISDETANLRKNKRSAQHEDDGGFDRAATDMTLRIRSGYRTETPNSKSVFNIDANVEITHQINQTMHCIFNSAAFLSWKITQLVNTFDES